mmetsp:Transcript_4428/g.10943  ORF Transcript_4428/g.10943 Transcript_4428/m.10943 type:complete len:265 (+) Transcript_4428:1103-1897(+)
MHTIVGLDERITQVVDRVSHEAGEILVVELQVVRIAKVREGAIFQIALVLGQRCLNAITASDLEIQFSLLGRLAEAGDRWGENIVVENFRGRSTRLQSADSVRHMSQILPEMLKYIIDTSLQIETQRTSRETTVKYIKDSIKTNFIGINKQRKIVEMSSNRCHVTCRGNEALLEGEEFGGEKVLNHVQFVVHTGEELRPLSWNVLDLGQIDVLLNLMNHLLNHSYIQHIFSKRAGERGREAKETLEQLIIGRVSRACASSRSHS